MEQFKVSAGTNPNSLAGAIAGKIREGKEVELKAIGAGAVNQAVKALAIARGFISPSGVNLTFIPGFVDASIDGQEKTALRFIIQKG